ncbi:CD209 antigen-like protein D [Pristis pectinata]|uniref:CD209 antigen-like protein D n=1 Tax=Pristis pectinata TaxID=685728 RepID=UPI00223E4B6D|nr:CD209 antigen-like protein D [Pristis pectinata]
MLFSFTDGINCPGDPDWHIFKRHCYLWSPTLSATWEKALSFCRAYRGTELLYLDTIDEKDWLATKVSGVYWTGLNDRAAESDFHWTTNDPLNAALIPYFRNDLRNGDLKDCVQLDTNFGLLTDIQCSVENNFVCKSKRVCVSEFPGPKCGTEDQLCNCIGIVQTSFSEVCGISVQACKNYCGRKKNGTDCSKCVPVCPDNAEEVLSMEEAVIVMLAKERIFGGASILTVNDQDYLDGFKVFYKKN